MIPHNLTEENYYSDAANLAYMSVSQFKMFAGSYGRGACEAAALAQLRGEYRQEVTTAMMVGSYVDHYFEGTLDSFKTEHPEMFKRDGGLKAEYIKAENVISRIQRDKLFMMYLSGQKQVIMVGELFGCQWKIKLDSYIPGHAIVDLKVMSEIYSPDEPQKPLMKWVPKLGYLDWIRYWGYDVQAAIYQEIVRQNTGETLPFYFAAASKQDDPAIGIFYADPQMIREALARVEQEMPRVLEVKYGEQEPDRCERCPYCRRTMVLQSAIAIDYPDLLHSHDGRFVSFG